jgi:hypothetical protein
LPKKRTKQDWIETEFPTGTEMTDRFHDDVIKTAALMILARQLFPVDKIDHRTVSKRSKKRGEQA